MEPAIDDYLESPIPELDSLSVLFELETGIELSPDSANEALWDAPEIENLHCLPVY